MHKIQVVFDDDKIHRILTSFNRITKMTITLFDSDLNPIDDAGPWQQYCLSIGNNEELLSVCKTCNRQHSAQALTQRETVIYTCHAGIAEAVAPIFVENTLIAYLMIGKFRDEEGIYTSEEKVVEFARRHDLDVDEMLEGYRKLPVFSMSYIDDAITVLEALICNITEKHYIHFHHNELALNIERYIEENLQRKLTVPELCKKFHLNKQSLYYIFKVDFNSTVQNFIIQKRLDKIRSLLVSTQDPINEIAESVGFTDYIYFLKFFKKRTGCTPSEYRTTKGKN